MKNIGTTIRDLRIQHRFSQTELAELIEVPAQSKISSWESGKTIPDLLEGQKLAKVFGIKLEDLFSEGDS